MLTPSGRRERFEPRERNGEIRWKRMNNMVEMGRGTQDYCLCAGDDISTSRISSCRGVSSSKGYGGMIPPACFTLHQYHASLSTGDVGALLSTYSNSLPSFTACIARSNSYLCWLYSVLRLIFARFFAIWKMIRFLCSTKIHTRIRTWENTPWNLSVC